MKRIGTAAIAGILLAALPIRAQATAGNGELLTRERNYAFAEYQNEEYGKAAEHFEKCVALAPHSIVDRINLGIAALQDHDQKKAIEVLQQARKIDASYPHISYLLGIAFLRLDEPEKARKELEALLRMDPLCAPAHYNLGVALKKLGRQDEAMAQWAEAVRFDPNHGSAYFQLFNAYNGRGDRDKAQAAFREYMRIKKSNVGPGTTSADVEKSRYLALIAETVAPHATTGGDIDVTFRDATQKVGLAEVTGSPAAALADVDDDGNLDLLLGRRLYRNQGGRFADVTAKSGIQGREPPTCAAFGDFDSDGKLDLALGGPSGLELYRGRGDGSFTNVTEHAGLTNALRDMSCAQIRFADIDHDGDLDIVAGGSRGIRLFRNNGNGTFSDVSAASHTGTPNGLVRSILLADFDSKNDLDIFAVEASGTHALYLNKRDGTFLEAAAAAGLHSTRPAVAGIAGDVNDDGLPDLVFIGGAKRPVEVWVNRGSAKFVKDVRSPVLAHVTEARGPPAGALVDIDNDGDLDLVVAGGKGKSAATVFRNDGVGGWTDATAAMLEGSPVAKGTQAVLAGDIDNDGDQDLLLVPASGPVTFLRNDGGNQNHSLRIRLRGRKNNPDGYGAKVWVRQGSFFLLRETFERWIDLGVGKRSKLDVVGLRWPTGITQNKLDVAAGTKTALEISERPGLAESCPFVYAFDGKQFRFVTDLLDTTPLGVSLVPGQPFVPNHREAIGIPGSRLVAKDGVLPLRITQELDEITYLDRLRLYAVDHPAGVAVVPNDRFSGAPFSPFAIHAVVPRPLRGARDGEGRDVRDALRNADRVYAYSCPPASPRYPGITRRHELILDPGKIPPAHRVLLFLRGTTLWTDASVNFAVAQNPDVPVEPVALDVIGRDGKWVRFRDDIGLPAGMDKLLPVDLTGALRSEDPRIRLTTNLAVLWDQAFLAVEGDAAGAKPVVTELVPLFADLHHRGFSQVESPDGRLPDVFVYQKMMYPPPFEGAPSGFYTRYGEVSELLQSADDMYVILAPGDEVAVDFPAIALPKLHSGWVRDYILDADGWIKDGDLRTIHGETVAPLPFHGMSGYPYPPSQHYPSTAAHRRYLETYQTRRLSEWAPESRQP